MATTQTAHCATQPALSAPARQLRGMIESYVVPQTIGAAARLGVADQLSQGPRTAQELAAATGAPATVLVRFLRACVAVGLLAEDEASRFSLTSLGDCLRSDGSSSLRNFAIANTSPGVWHSLGRLADAVLTGRAAAEVALGMPLWQYFRQHPEEGVHFAAGLSETSSDALGDFFAHYDLSWPSRIVDVGAGSGEFLCAMLEQAQTATGILYDMPEVVERAATVLKGRGTVADRIELAGGDFLDSVPAGGDLYTLKAVLCDWPDSEALRILENCHGAGRPESRLLVVDRILPADNRSTPLYLGDMFTLAVCGGRVRDQKTFEALFAQAGYSLAEVVLTSATTAVMVARKEAQPAKARSDRADFQGERP